MGRFLLLLRYLSLVLIVAASFLLISILGPVTYHEVAYYVSKPSQNPHTFSPPTSDFYLYLPKLSVGSPVIANVDPYDAVVYQSALAKGIAHAANTALPGELGNIFLFSHSAANLLQATSYNSVFYLLHHLEPNDPIYVWHGNSRYTYRVTKQEIVSGSDVSYLNPNTQSESLTLMTCYPPGTTSYRLLVHAQRSAE